jgi:hypothetical protein
MKENFSVSDLNPMNKIKEIAIFLLVLLIKVIIIGLIFYTIMSKIGLMSQASIKNYIIYFIAGSVTMFAITFAYFAFLCRKNKFDGKKLAKLSMLGPSIIAAHVIVLIVSPFIKDIPEIGIIIYGLLWSSVGVVLLTGIMYSIGLGVAEYTAQCGT